MSSGSSWLMSSHSCRREAEGGPAGALVPRLLRERQRSKMINVTITNV